MGRLRMPHPLDPESRIGRLRAFYENNPDEELSVDDVAVKFGCSIEQAYKMIHKMMRVGLLVSVGRRPTVYRRQS
jgi:Fic family protein